jgi:hypothetical protein
MKLALEQARRGGCNSHTHEGKKRYWEPLVWNIICSVQLAISLSNSSGAWDNSKK